MTAKATDYLLMNLPALFLITIAQVVRLQDPHTADTLQLLGAMAFQSFLPNRTKDQTS